MKRHFSKFVNVATLAIAVICCTLNSCQNNDDLGSFILEDPKSYNDQLRNGASNNECWSKSPILITNKFFGPDYHTEGRNGFKYDEEEVNDSHLIVSTVREGLL